MSTPTFSPLSKTCAVLALVISASFATSATAGPREQAKRIHDRIAGVPPSAAVLTAMEADITDGNADAAALKAMANPDFYRVTLKNFITPWTNEAQTVFAPLNDYTATVIGVIRDDYDFRRILWDDILYTGTSPSGLNNSNAHYQALENTGADLSDPTVLIERSQSATTGLPASATAGVLTSRAAAKAFFVDGTNRAMFRFTLLNHLCNDMEQLQDASYPADRVRQDVSRSPGGDSRIYMNACIGCHTGMDPMTQAFAYYDYSYNLAPNGDPDYESGSLSYTPDTVQPKYLQNGSNFEFGYVTPDDSWENYWRVGSNSALGWDPALTGNGSGASSMGRELAHSDAFARCQVEKVFKAMCFRTPVDAADRSQVDAMIASFKAAGPNGYSLKQVFVESAVFCMGS